MLKYYADRSKQRWFKRHTRNQYMRNVDIEHYPNGIIVNEYKHGFGIFDKDFKFIKSSRQTRKNNGQFVPKFDRDNVPYVDEDVVFVGNVYPQFGHFLLEHINRAYAALDKKYQNMKFILINNEAVNPVPNYMFDLLMFLGIKRENILILNKTTRFRNVYVPQQGFNIPVYSSDKFGKTYDKIAQNINQDFPVFDKIYVSRAKLNSRKTYGEEKVQKVFERNGYKIIYPETMSLQEQIGIIKNCKYLAGCAGTALHLALVMKSGGTVIQIKRNSLNEDNSTSQYLINKTKNLNSVFIQASVEKVRTNHGSFTPQIIGINKYMRDFFKDFGFKTVKSDFEKDTVAWQEYMDALAEYEKVHGSKFMELVKRAIVRISACFIPGRYNRGVWRNWLKGKLRL
jgi:capsular polysaccharide biosynthesis protein